MNRATRAELLDALAGAIDAPRRDGRLDAIRRAFAEYTEALEKKPWWQFWVRKGEETRPFWV